MEKNKTYYITELLLHPDEDQKKALDESIKAARFVHWTYNKTREKYMEKSGRYLYAVDFRIVLTKLRNDPRHPFLANTQCHIQQRAVKSWDKFYTSKEVFSFALPTECYKYYLKKNYSLKLPKIEGLIETTKINPTFEEFDHKKLYSVSKNAEGVYVLLSYSREVSEDNDSAPDEESFIFVNRVIDEVKRDAEISEILEIANSVIEGPSKHRRTKMKQYNLQLPPKQTTKNSKPKTNVLERFNSVKKGYNSR